MDVRLEGVKKSFDVGGHEIQVLKGVELEIKKGEHVAIVGVSGSGKTTLLSIIGTILKPDEGKVLLDGKEIQNLGESELWEFRKRIGFVFQNGYLIPELNVIENITFFASQRVGEKRAKEFAKSIIEKFGLEGLEKKNVWELSGGEYQRVALARALCYFPSLLLADEPTGNLDEKTAQDVMTQTVSFCKEKGITLITVTHNRKIAELMERIFLLEDGKVKEIS